MILFIVLIIINLWILYSIKEPKVFIEVKEKYKIFREHLEDTDNKKFHMLRDPKPITGYKRMNGVIGYNTNKGGEIAVCLDGDANEIFHVLIHELAHCTVKEYTHSPEFWKNYTELRDMCVELGIYKKIPQRTKFCGKHIQDK